jgi:hypothetical protein
MKSKNTLHERILLSIRRWRRDPLLGFLPAIENACEQLVGLLGRQQVLQMMKDPLDGFSNDHESRLEQQVRFSTLEQRRIGETRSKRVLRS